MGLLSKKPSASYQYKIQVAIEESQKKYKDIVNTERIDWFLSDYEDLYKHMNVLLKAEKKYPSFFRKPKPSDNWKKIQIEREEVEREFINRYIYAIEKKLLQYKTKRGKCNNFNKEVDIFKFYAGEFLPQTVEYFTRMIEERFSEYIS